MCRRVRIECINCRYVHLRRLGINEMPTVQQVHADGFTYIFWLASHGARNPNSEFNQEMVAEVDVILEFNEPNT